MGYLPRSSGQFFKGLAAFGILRPGDSKALAEADYLLGDFLKTWPAVYRPECYQSSQASAECVDCRNFFAAEKVGENEIEIPADKFRGISSKTADHEGISLCILGNMGELGLELENPESPFFTFQHYILRARGIKQESFSSSFTISSQFLCELFVEPGPPSAVFQLVYEIVNFGRDDKVAYSDEAKTFEPSIPLGLTSSSFRMTP